MNNKGKLKKHFPNKASNVFMKDVLKDEDYFLPADTRKYIEHEIKTIDNFYLRLQKAACFQDNKFIFYKKDKNGETINVLRDYNLLKTKLNSTIRALHTNFKSQVSDLLGSTNIKSGVFTPDWRLVIGLGSESVYETSITLHPVYGIPYIPGQAIKGITRSHVINECFNQSEKEALKDKLFCHIFGAPAESVTGEYQGSVIFFDALPTTVPELEIDIINPHYSEYYQNQKPPVDYLKPIPVFFLTVKNTGFEFFVGQKKPETAFEILGNKKSPLITGGLTGDTKLFEIAFEWLKNALINHGIGAKTSVGYGHFR